MPLAILVCAAKIPGTEIPMKNLRTVSNDGQGRQRSIILTYSDFQSLPKGVKQMLVLSESLFFADARPDQAGAAEKRSRAHAKPYTGLPAGGPNARPRPRPSARLNCKLGPPLVTASLLV